MQTIMLIMCEYPTCGNRASYRCLGCKRLICFPCYAQGCEYHSKGTGQHEPNRGALSHRVDRPGSPIAGKKRPAAQRPD